MKSFLVRKVRQGRHSIVLTACGVPSDRTGMVLNIVDIDRVVRRAENRGVLHLDTQHPEVYCMCLYNTWRDSTDIVGDSGLHSVEIKDSDRETIWRFESEGKMLYSTRSWQFCASHRLNNPELSSEENIRLYGKCNNRYGHGHNFDMDLTFRDKPPLDIDRVVDEEVFDRFDHKHLNEDCPELDGIIPTTENFVKVLWRVLNDRIGNGKLVKISLRETHKNSFEYYG